MSGNFFLIFVRQCLTLYVVDSIDFVIESLVVDEHRINHIARHEISIKEVLEVVLGNYVYIKGREDRWLLIGKTKKERFLTVVVGERAKKNTYGLVTARPSRRDERSFYKEIAKEQGGEEVEQN